MTASARGPLKPSLSGRISGHMLGRFVVFVVLLGLAGQLLLHALSRPDELPCEEIARLGGFVMPAMTAPMVMDAPPMPAGMEMGARIGRIGEIHAPSSPLPHKEQTTCPLCPLLQLVAIILTSLPALPFCTVQRYRLDRRARAPRAPPAPWLGLPRSRAPPAFS